MCESCMPGQYCSGVANIVPDGDCAEGFYCTGGSPSQYPFLTGDLLNSNLRWVTLWCKICFEICFLLISGQGYILYLQFFLVIWHQMTPASPCMTVLVQTSCWQLEEYVQKDIIVQKDLLNLYLVIQEAIVIVQDLHYQQVNFEWINQSIRMLLWMHTHLYMRWHSQ